jgi:hypothetical protein
MPVKIARSAPRPSFGLPELLVAIHTSRQSCKAAKARIFTPIRESSGESRLRARGRIDTRHPATSARPEWLGSKDPAPGHSAGFLFALAIRRSSARARFSRTTTEFSAQGGTGFDAGTGSAGIARYAFGGVERRVVAAWKPQPSTGDLPRNAVAWRARPRASATVEFWKTWHGSLTPCPDRIPPSPCGVPFRSQGAATPAPFATRRLATWDLGWRRLFPSTPRRSADTGLIAPSGSPALIRCNAAAGPHVPNC